MTVRPALSVRWAAIWIAGAVAVGALPLSVVAVAFGIVVSDPTENPAWSIAFGAAASSPFVLGALLSYGAGRRPIEPGDTVWQARLTGLTCGLWIGVGLLVAALVPAAGVVVIDHLVHHPDEIPL